MENLGFQPFHVQSDHRRPLQKSRHLSEVSLEAQPLTPKASTPGHTVASSSSKAGLTVGSLPSHQWAPQFQLCYLCILLLEMVSLLEIMQCLGAQGLLL